MTLIAVIEVSHLIYVGVVAGLSGFFLWRLLDERRRVRRLRQERDEIDEEEHRMFDFLHGLSGALQEDSSPPAMHRYIVHGVSKVVEADGGILYLIDSENHEQLLPVFISDKGFTPVIELTERVLHDPDKRLRSHLRSTAVSRDSGLIGETLITRKTCSTDDLLEHPSFSGIADNPWQRGLAVMASPLIYGKIEVGVLVVSRKDKPFSDNDRDVFASIAEQSSFALGSAIIHAEAHEKRRYDEELQRAAEIQRILLPKNPPDLADYKVASTYKPARIVSGDYFDYVRVDDDRYGVIIGDVCGKGIAASLIMAMCRSLVRSNAPGAIHPTSVLHAVNRAVYPDIREDMFISLLYLILDRNSDRIVFARAGHEPVYIFRAETKEIDTYEPPGMAVGIDGGGVFERVLEDSRLSLNQGDVLLLCTDGVIEAMNPLGDEFGTDRMLAALGEHATEGAESVVDAISHKIEEFTDTALQSDDITLIAIEKH